MKIGKIFIPDAALEHSSVKNFFNGVKVESSRDRHDLGQTKEFVLFHELFEDVPWVIGDDVPEYWIANEDNGGFKAIKMPKWSQPGKIMSLAVGPNK